MAKRFKDNIKRTKKTCVNALAVILIIVGIFIVFQYFYKKDVFSVEKGTYKNESNIIDLEMIENENNEDNIIENQEEQKEGNEIENNVTENKVVENKTQEKIDINTVKEIKGYKVIGRIKINKLNYEDIILDKTTTESLKLGLTKFWGPEMNEVGNFSISGHNYKIDRSQLFSKLDNLTEGDTFSLKDLKGRTVNYKIYKKYKVLPSDTSTIDQNEDGKREVTLITCTRNAKERIIFKAREY